MRLRPVTYAKKTAKRRKQTTVLQPSSAQELARFGEANGVLESKEVAAGLHKRDAMEQGAGWCKK